MIRTLVILSILFASASSLSAQETYYQFFSYQYFIPRVSINDRSADLQQALFSDLYRHQSVRSDMRWVVEHDSALVQFWQTRGDTALHILRELSGIEWYETDFDIYLVRYFTSAGSSDPLILPVGGLRRANLTEPAPEYSHQVLNLVFQLARRNLAQTVQPEDSIYLSLANHPLMRPGPFRRDNLAMLLAIATCQNLLGIDSTFAAFESVWWRRHFPSRTVLQHYLLNQWILTPDYPLADWIAAEPSNSRLVAATRPPRQSRPKTQARPQHFVEGLSLKGLLGFSVVIDEAGRLVVDKIDLYRLAYACGLREKDRLRRVDDHLVRNHKELVERIFETMDQGGATVQIIRDGRVESVIIRPIVYVPFQELFFPDEAYDDLPDNTEDENPDQN
ncbi:MAG: PDZ domain-containing protein [Candidatus Zixiibacteriota bacterium]